MPLSNIQIWELATSNSWIYVVALIFLYVIYILRNYIRLVKITLCLDGPPALPLIGNIHYYFKPNVMNEMKKYSTYNIIRLWVSFIPYLAIIQPEDIQIILSSSKHTRKPFVYSLFKNVIGKGLTINDGEASKMHRNIIQKAFNVHGLEKFTEIFVEHAEYLTSILRDIVNQDMNITKLINDVIYNIQAEIVLGLKLIKENKKNNETRELPFKVNEMFASYRFKRPWLLFESLYKLTKKSQIDKQQLDNNIAYCYDIIKKIEKSKRLNSYDMTNDETQTENGRMSLLEFMVNMKQKYSYFNDEAILNECSTFMLAGLESVSTATACMLFLLANHPECQKKCVNELDEIYNNNDTLTSFKSLKEMKYLEMCIKETLRLYPAIPVIARCLTEDIKIDGRIIPTGTSVLISPYLTHRIPRYYLDPESFKPERFDPQNSDEKLHPYAYIPFSAGPKNCIGYKFAILEMKVLVSSILRNFVLEPIANKNKIYVKYRMTLRAQGGLWIKFRLRNTM
ncbi:probable cytochrome P450 4aa1 isoform X3 [Vespa velutina]|uniref:probable cytochrome P450 4aa1 isoform X3 n=1 Tax=Vespa velutina TaxID=202808 RepID=UPI001FB2EEC3|nr:probable cytochrome P450 4aa1 isoform X3 [Vespa velutina]